MKVEIDGENLYSLIGNFEKEGYVLESKVFMLEVMILHVMVEKKKGFLT